jgi:hypothetical protein
MKTSALASRALVLALVSGMAGCATWHGMDHQEKGTAVGATGGAVVGAAVGGPIGAAVGAGVGGYAGHHETKPGGIAAGPAGSTSASSASPTVRSAQEALNARGYNVGSADGVMGPSTETAVRDYQRAQGLAVTGSLDSATLGSLGVAGQ